MANESFRRYAVLELSGLEIDASPKRPAFVQAGSRIWSETIARVKPIRLRSLMQSQRQSIIPDGYSKCPRIHHLTAVAKQA